MIGWGLAGELDALREVMGDGDQREMLSRLLTKVASLETAIAAAEATRRDLHNQLVELRGNVSLHHSPHNASAVTLDPVTAPIKTLESWSITSIVHREVAKFDGVHGCRSGSSVE